MFRIFHKALIVAAVALCVFVVGIYLETRTSVHVLAQPAPPPTTSGPTMQPTQPANPQEVIEKTIGNLFVGNLQLKAEVERLNAENRRLHDELDARPKK